MSIFQKTYTRDTALIIQECWAAALSSDCGVLNAAYHEQPVVIDYLCDGASEIWENKRAISYLRASFVEKSKLSQKTILDAFKEYENILPELEVIWRAGVIESMPLFKEFLLLMDRCMKVNVLYSYLSDEPEADAEVFVEAQKLRGADRFFAKSDLVVRQTLSNMYPQHRKYIVCIRAAEIDEMPSTDECSRRFHNYVITSEGYAAIESLATYAQKHPNISFEHLVANSTEEAQGSMAMPGRVRGVVKILRRNDEMSKVEIGDVIVAPMTTPTLMPALQKASAFVTDEGGVLCHAAVTARELGKPCIIGTRFATQIFKDGDMVEVDADKGIVRRI